VEVEAKSKLVRVDEETATIKANEAQALKNECESDLAEAIPALEAALSALDTLKVNYIFYILLFTYYIVEKLAYSDTYRITVLCEGSYKSLNTCKEDNTCHKLSMQMNVINNLVCTDVSHILNEERCVSG